MNIKNVDYGTTFDVVVLSCTENVLTVRAPEINEGFILVGHGVHPLPVENDKGVIVFVQDKGIGHWEFTISDSNFKEKILNTISDLVSDFVYYNRKEDEELSAEQLNAAVKNGDITIEEMVEAFREGLNNTFNKAAEV